MSKLKAAADPIPVTLVAAAPAAQTPTEFEEAPLFEFSLDDKKITHVLVQRTDPDEGVVGRMPPTVTEMDLKRRWGGGTFMLQGRDDKNHSIKGAHRTVTIGGDPLFESKSAEMKWRRAQGLDSNGQQPAADKVPEAIGVRDLFALLTSTEAKQKAETERRMEEQDAAHRRELERLKVEGEMRARERAEEDVRRERMAEEREERRRKEEADREERRLQAAEEREDRRRKDDEAARARDREFQLLIKKGSSDPSDLLLKGIALARELGGGGGESDPVSSVAAALLPGLKDILSGNGKAPAPRGDSVVFEGEIAGKVRRAVAHLQAEGFDPEMAIGSVLETVTKMKRQTAPMPPPATVPPPAPSARAPAMAPARAPTVRRPGRPPSRRAP